MIPDVDFHLLHFTWGHLRLQWFQATREYRISHAGFISGTRDSSWSGPVPAAEKEESGLVQDTEVAIRNGTIIYCKLWGSIVMMKGNHIRHWPKTKSLAFEEAHFDYDKGGNNFGLSWRTAPNKVGWRSMLQTQKKSGYSPMISPTFACLGLVLLFLIVSRRSCVQMWLWICRRANCPFGMFFGLNPNQHCSCCRTSTIRHQYQNWCFFSTTHIRKNTPQRFFSWNFLSWAVLGPKSMPSAQRWVRRSKSTRKGLAYGRWQKD